jgi:hypothetical protein
LEKEVCEGKIDSFSGKGRLSSEDEAFRQLKRENKFIRMEPGVLKKSDGRLLGGTAMKYFFIRNNREIFPVDLMFRSLGVVSSGFYAWMKLPKIPHRRDNLRLWAEIKAVHRKRRKTYGNPRIHKV